MAAPDHELTIDGRRIGITSPDKALFGPGGPTKRDLVDYYAAIGPVMVRHVSDRPATMRRYPAGIDGKGFFQKQTPDFFPDWIPRIGLANKERVTDHPVIDETAALVYLAQQNTITVHVGLARVADLDSPDRFVIDLDPSTDDFVDLCAIALEIRSTLDELGLVPFVQTTGSKGLHIVVPVIPEVKWPAIHAFGSALAQVLIARHPGRLTSAFRRRDRGSAIYLDLGRNASLSTMAAPYSVRARPGAPVATPVTWDELTDPALGPQRYDIGSVLERLTQREDPWLSIDDHARSLAPGAARLAKLVSSP